MKCAVLARRNLFAIVYLLHAPIYVINEHAKSMVTSCWFLIIPVDKRTLVA